MLGRKARPVILGQLATIADTQKHVMRHDHVAFFETAVIRGHQRDIGTDGRIQQNRLGAPFGIKAMTLQFHIDTARQRIRERGKPFSDKRRLTFGSCSADKAVHRAAGKQDQSYAVSTKCLQLDHRIIAALNLEKGARIVAAQRLVSGLALRQKHHFAAAARIRDEALQPDDRLDPCLTHFFTEFQRAEHVVGVGDGHRRLRIATCKRHDRLQAKRRFRQRIG